jgi:hypothetical protein
MKLPAIIFAICALATTTFAQKPAKPSALSPIEDQPGLPRVLLVGDSISIGYTPPVRELLKGKANLHRIPTNGGPTKNGTANIEKWLGTGKWDVIHFNWGIHDLKFLPDGKRQVEAEDYEKNLPPRKFGKVPEYNAIAESVMKENGVTIDDLHAAITPRLAELQNPKDVHYKPEGYAFLAKHVAASIEAALAAKK